MGFVGEVMENVKGIQLFSIIGLFIFIALFFVMLIRTMRMPKKELIDIKTAILDTPETSAQKDSI